MEKVTIEALEAHDSVMNAIDWAIDQYGEYPEKPQKPMLPAKHTAEEVKSYVVLLEQYEDRKVSYESCVVDWRDNRDTIDAVIVKFIKEVTGLNSNVPEQYRDKVYARAWTDGHSSGFYEVYLKLDQLVEIFV